MLPPRHHVPCAVRRKSNFCHPPDGLNHLYMKDLKEESIMDILNIVFSALNLLATVIIGVINVTWMISRMSFVTSLGQRTILKNDKKNDRPTVYQTQAVIYS